MQTYRLFPEAFLFSVYALLVLKIYIDKEINLRVCCIKCVVWYENGTRYTLCIIPRVYEHFVLFRKLVRERTEVM